MNILFSSCGRRVELIRKFREALNECGGGNLIGMDINPLAPALFEVDKNVLAPRYDSDEFLAFVQNVCEQESVDLLVPLIDPELSIYSENIEMFNSCRTRILVSRKEVIDICSDKLLTSLFLEEQALPFLRTTIVGEEPLDSSISIPAVLKPRDGSGGIDVFVVNDLDEIDVLSNRISNPVLQEKAEGQEITIDCLVDFEGKPLRIVERERLEIRAGESSKGRTIKDNNLTDLTVHLLTSLQACGPVTVQCFRNNGEYVFTEINPRFGGGYPLAHSAGADFPGIILKLLCGKPVKENLMDYDENLYFCRYDDAFYLTQDRRSYHKRKWNKSPF